MNTDTLLDTCAVAAYAIVALVLVLEAGLLVGIALPAASLVLGLGAVAGAAGMPLPLVALGVTTATVLGAALGHRAARRRSGGELLTVGGVLGRRLTGRATGVIDRTTTPWREAIERRPVRAAATAQFIVGARTLVPRLAASAGVPLATMLRGTAPAALAWSSALVATGALAGAALPLVRDLLAVAGIPLALAAATWLLVRRRARSAAGVSGGRVEHHPVAEPFELGDQVGGCAPRRCAGPASRRPALDRAHRAAACSRPRPGWSG